MKKNIRAKAISLLLSDLSKGFAQDQLNEILLTDSYSEPDRQLLAGIVYGVLRNKMYLDYIIGGLTVKKTKKFLAVFLEVAIFQSIFMDKIPEYAIVAETLKASKVYNLNQHQKNFLRGVLGSFLKEKKNGKYDKSWESSLPLYVRYSHPEWIVREFERFLSPQDVLRCLKTGNEIPNIIIFPHTKKISVSELEKYFNDFEIKFEKVDDGRGLRIVKLLPPVRELLNDGKIYVQGIHQFKAVNLCPCKNNDMVLEVGAAPGGKTISLSEKVGLKGKVFALDKNQKRIKRLKDRVSKMELSNVEIINGDITENILDDYIQFDHVVIDPPCSNLGELSKRVEVRYRLEKKDLTSLKKIQIKMIDKTYTKLKIGGTLLYITCTLSFDENQGIRDYIINSYDAELQKELLTLPDGNDSSGGYACLIKKNG